MPWNISQVNGLSTRCPSFIFGEICYLVANMSSIIVHPGKFPFLEKNIIYVGLGIYFIQGFSVIQNKSPVLFHHKSYCTRNRWRPCFTVTRYLKAKTNVDKFRIRVNERNPVTFLRFLFLGKGHSITAQAIGSNQTKWRFYNQRSIQLLSSELEC